MFIRVLGANVRTGSGRWREVAWYIFLVRFNALIIILIVTINHLNINIKSLFVVQLRLVISVVEVQSILGFLLLIVFVALIHF